jgi:hypothetical protein
MTETTRRLRELADAGADVCIVMGRVDTTGLGYCVYSEEGMCLEAGALTAAEAAEARRFARVD